MKKKLLLLMLLIYSITTVGQDDFALQVDKSTSRTSGEFWRTIRGRRLTSLTIGLQRSNYFNTEHYYKNGNTLWMNYSINIAPVLLDVSVGEGLSAFVSYVPLLPDFGKFSEIFQPYIGIGYSSEGDAPEMWKGGIKLQFGWFSIRGEYLQSLSVTTPDALRTIQIGAGFGLFWKHKKR
jgi:hypothetical protein